MWVVPSGQGKSRIAATTAFIILQLCEDTPKVHLVFENQYLMERDRADFYSMFEMCDLAEKIEYHVGIDFRPAEKEVVIVDEADCFVFD
jgi:preprotein translocase subunit SecA